MDREYVLKQWIESTRNAEAVLRRFRRTLELCKVKLGEDNSGQFEVVMRLLNAEGLEDWVASNPLNLDTLAAIVAGEDVPEPHPLTEEELLRHIFGRRV